MDYNIRLPDFLIIGANKAGTSSLASYCAQHPGIHMSWPLKEPMFFTTMRAGHAPAAVATPAGCFTLAEFAALFAAARDDQLCGEASTSYLANPQVAVWIQKLIPQVKLIAILREPIDRALSAYRMYRGMGVEPRSFEEAVLQELGGADSRIPQGRRYLSMGLYGRSLVAFRSRFPREQMLIASYDELSRDNLGFLARVFAFLALEAFVPPDLARLNAGSDYAPDAVTLAGCDPSLRRRLVAYFEADLTELAKVVDFDLTSWTTAQLR